MKRTVTAALAATLFAAPEARACGGFFCNQMPVDQTGEQIVFSVENNEVTAHIRINYQGSADDFAWVVPVPAQPGPPELGSDSLFTALLGRLMPQFYLDWNYEGACEDWGYYWDSAAADGGEGEAEAEGEGEDVTVSFRGAVGPYDAAVISSDDADALRAWLTDNGYDVPDAAAGPIDYYVGIGNWFVALKLLSDADVGDLQPIVLRFAFDRPCVPLVLTAIASVPNLDVRLWVLGDARAIPTNYRHVLVDEAKIDWLCYGQNYDQVVTDAANETGGQAFVTEYAGTSDVMAKVLYTEGRFDLDALRGMEAPLDWLREVMVVQAFPPDATLLAVLLEHVPPPDDWWGAPTDFYNQVLDDPALWDYLETLDFDAVEATADLDQRIVTPLAAAQAMFDASPYLTQMFTTISPDEMTRDPMFGFNADLADVDLVHSATATLECRAGGTYTEIALADGRKLWLSPDEQGCAPPDAAAPVGTLARLLADLPGSEKAEQLPEGGGQGAQVYSNADEIDEILARHNAAVLGGMFGGGDYDNDGGGCGCDTGRAPTSPAALALLALLLAAAIVRRRRR